MGLWRLVTLTRQVIVKPTAKATLINPPAPPTNLTFGVGT